VNLNFLDGYSKMFKYWHDPLHLDTYVEKSQFIGEINNEGPIKNQSYAENLAKLETFVLVKYNQV